MGACCGKMPDAADFLAQFSPEPEKCLGPPEDDVVVLAMKEKILSLSGQDFSIKSKDGKVVAIMQGKNLSLRDRSVLKDAAGEPVACILEKMLSMSISFFVYSFKPYFKGQEPTSEKQGGQPLYAWAKVWKKSMSVTDEFHICMATGNNEYEPANEGSYKALAPGYLSSQLMVTKGGQGCCLITRAELQWGDLIGGNHYEVSIAAGIDPILMVALVGIRDRAAEKER